MLRTITLAVVTCAVAMSAHSQASAPQSGEAWDNVKTYSVEKKNEAVAYGKKLVRDTDAKIKDLERQAARSKGEAKAALEQNIAELKEKRAQAAAKLDEMGKASAGAWEATKQGFADAYQDLQDAYRRAVAQFKKK
jgi:predicted phage tail protein